MNYSNLSTVIAGAILATTAFSTVYAQQVPTSVDPANLERRFEPTNTSTPAAATNTGEATLPTSTDASRFANITPFTLNNVQVEGATIYESTAFSDAYTPYIGKRIGTEEARAIAEKITAQYRSEGYILSQAIVQPQSTRDGTLTITVYEGFIGNVIIQGDAKTEREQEIIRGYASKIKAEQPLNAASLERYLLLMDDLPGVVAQSVIRPSANVVGAADIVVTIELDPWEVSLNTNNRGSEFVGPWQHTASVGANSLFGMFERTYVRMVTTSPNSELRFIDLVHEQQLGSEGTVIELNGAYSHSEPGHTLSVLNIEGDSYSLGAKVEHPFIRSRVENLVGYARLDYRDTNTELLGADFSADKLRVLRAGGGYDFADGWQGVNLVEVEASQGFDILNATDTGINRSRANGEADFTKFNLDLSRTQPISSSWSLFAAASGQYSLDPLLASEQFLLGGGAFGRAFDPAEIAGDHGAAARTELRFGRGVQNESFLQSYQIYGYYDIGKVWNEDGTTGDNNTLSSAGVGIRTNFTHYLSSELEVGKPLIKSLSAHGDQDPRVFVSVTGRF